MSAYYRDFTYFKLRYKEVQPEINMKSFLNNLTFHTHWLYNTCLYHNHRRPTVRQKPDHHQKRMNKHCNNDINNHNCTATHSCIQGNKFIMAKRKTAGDINQNLFFFYTKTLRVVFDNSKYILDIMNKMFCCH